jgi:hypothetical protein
MEDFNCDFEDFEKVVELPYEFVMKNPRKARAGVYVWKVLDDGKQRVIRVGKSDSNVQKRALEHVKRNTWGVMEGYAAKPGLSLTLYELVSPSKIHSVYALEYYLEKTLKPECPQGRRVLKTKVRNHRRDT